MYLRVFSETQSEITNKQAESMVTYKVLRR